MERFLNWRGMRNNLHQNRLEAWFETNNATPIDIRIQDIGVAPVECARCLQGTETDGGHQVDSCLIRDEIVDDHISKNRLASESSDDGRVEKRGNDAEKKQHGGRKQMIHRNIGNACRLPGK